MKYALIKKHSPEHAIAVLCRTLEVSRNGYQQWLHHGESRRAKADRTLVKAIKKVHKEAREAYGAVKTWRELRGSGIACGKHRVGRLRREHGICTKRRQAQLRKHRYTFTHPAANDLLQRQFKAERPNQVWVGDMTFVRTLEGWLHLAVLLDLYSRKVIGWAMDASPGQSLHTNALCMALRQRKPRPGLIHHSDRGTQYRTGAYSKLLADHGVRASMNGTAFPQDNAVAESFFSTLKNELVHHQTFRSRSEARSAIFKYIETFYNRVRLHQGLGYRTPEQVEQQN